MNYIKYLQYLPLFIKLVDFIRQAQSEFTGPDSGEQKMRWVVGRFTDVVRSAQQSGLVPAKLGDTIVIALPALVEVIVQVLKAVHGSVPPADKPQPVPAPVPTPSPAPTPAPTPTPAIDVTTVEYNTIDSAIAATDPQTPNVILKPNGKYCVWPTLGPFPGTKVYPSTHH